MNDYNNKKYSDEYLNAFIDDELDTSEKTEILSEVRHDSELSQRVCQLQKLHNLVQLSYESIEVPERHKNKNSAVAKSRFKWLAAASLFLAIGSLTGWVSHQQFGTTKTSLAEIAHVTQLKPADEKSELWKVMLHVSTDDPNRLNIILNETEALLKSYAESSRKLELEILTNNKGMTLVTDNGEPYSKRLRKLQSKYQNLVLMACGETLKRISATHKQLPLLPKTSVVSSALNQIVKRKKEGWTYIRI